MIETIAYITKAHLKMAMRSKQSIFFSYSFPLFLFALFSFVGIGGDTAYINHLYVGVIAISIASEGLFIIGPTIKSYCDSGMIKYFKLMPANILVHFVGVIICRLVILIVIAISLCFISLFVYNNTVPIGLVMGSFIGIVVGTIIFGFTGFIISFSNKAKSRGKSFATFFYFITVFTSNCFYPIEEFNSKSSFIGDLLPMNGVLILMRDLELTSTIWWWVSFPVVLFYILVISYKVVR